MIIKKFIYILILLALTNCGYQPIYNKSKNTNYSIKDIEIEGNKKINRKIITFANLKENNNQAYAYNISLNSTKKIEIVSKDQTGTASIFRTTISVNLSLKDPNDKNIIVKSKNFTSSFSYSNTKNKFDLQQYQKNIEENLIIKIAEEIIIFLNL